MLIFVLCRLAPLPSFLKMVSGMVILSPKVSLLYLKYFIFSWHVWLIRLDGLLLAQFQVFKSAAGVNKNGNLYSWFCKYYYIHQILHHWWHQFTAVFPKVRQHDIRLCKSDWPIVISHIFSIVINIVLYTRLFF